jgi:hypothetical protein
MARSISWLGGSGKRTQQLASPGNVELQALPEIISMHLK